MTSKIFDYCTLLICCLLLAATNNLEWLAWLSVAFFGVLIINELIYRQPTANDEINKRLDLIIFNTEQIMTKEERLAQAVADLNAGTNEIAADLQRLKDEIAAGTISEESLAALETNIAVLTALGNAQ